MRIQNGIRRAKKNDPVLPSQPAPIALSSLQLTQLATCLHSARGVPPPRRLATSSQGLKIASYHHQQDRLRPRPRVKSNSFVPISEAQFQSDARKLHPSKWRPKKHHGRTENLFILVFFREAPQQTCLSRTLGRAAVTTGKELPEMGSLSNAQTPITETMVVARDLPCPTPLQMCY